MVFTCGGQYIVFSRLYDLRLADMFVLRSFIAGTLYVVWVPAMFNVYTREDTRASLSGLNNIFVK